MNEYRKELVEKVKGVGQELIDRADEIVAYKDLNTGFNISIDIDPGDPVYITVTQNYISETVLKQE